MTTYYKLTDQDGKTGIGHVEVMWGPRVTHTATRLGVELCTDGYIHAYTDSLLAVLLNPIHGNFANPRMFSFETEEEPLREGQLKCGFKTISFGAWMDMPKVNTTQKVAFGILCAKAVCKNTAWNTWADDWLSGKNRSAAEASKAAEEAARAAAFDLVTLARQAMGITT